MPLPGSPSVPWTRTRSASACAAAIVLWLGTAGCFEPLLSPSQYATVRVTTSTPDGTPVPEVRLTLYTGQRPIEYAVSDADGGYVFERVPPGNYGVLAHFPDEFRDPSESPYLVKDALFVEAGEEVSVVMSQSRCVGAVTLTVRDSTGRPGRAVPVSLYSSDGPVAQGVTDAAGGARFAGLSCREYGITLGASASCTLVAGRGRSFADGVAVTRARPEAAVTLTVGACS